MGILFGAGYELESWIVPWSLRPSLLPGPEFTDSKSIT
jgi:hypothetical protein